MCCKFVFQYYFDRFKMTYRTVLDLELDDWIDPSLPRMYTLPLCPIPFQFYDEFTPQNEEFLSTTLLPLWTPVMGSDGLCLKEE